MKTKFFLFFLLLCLGFSSCEKEDDLSGPMKWKIEPGIQIFEENYHQVIQIPAEGGEYTLTCTNYNGFTELYVSEISLYMDGIPIRVTELTDSQPRFENGWLSISKEKDRSAQKNSIAKEKHNAIRIVAQPNQTASSRQMYLWAAVGDGVEETNFLIRQAAGKQE
ncbi:MAG: hypothetical protein J6M53_04035 [Bacteroidaceae bacterium]|nr:hypothetical protein [Bacteroidaceae bacterium]